MICEKCNQYHTSSEYSFWCYKKDEMPTGDGVVPVHRFSAVICDRCIGTRRTRIVIPFSVVMAVIALLVMMGVGHDPSRYKWAFLFSGLTFIGSLVIGYFQAKKELLGSGLAVGLRKKQLSEDGFEGFFPSKPQSITRYR